MDFVLLRSAYRAFGIISFAFEELLHWAFAIRFANRRPLQWYVYRNGRPSSRSDNGLLKLSD